MNERTSMFSAFLDHLEVYFISKAKNTFMQILLNVYSASRANILIALSSCKQLLLRLSNFIEVVAATSWCQKISWSRIVAAFLFYDSLLSQVQAP